MPLFDNTQASASSNNQTGERRGVTLSDTVAAGATETLRYTIPSDSTIEAVMVRFYVGTELSLRIRPYIEQDGEEGETDVIRTVGKDYLDGDSDAYEWKPSLPVERGDVLVVEAENLSGTYDYDWRMNVDLDARGGLRSFVEDLLGGAA